jgi:hypothetical protein
MHEVPVAAFAAPVHEPGLFQVGNQLSHLSRHFSIKLVSQWFAVVKARTLVSINSTRGFFRGGTLHGEGEFRGAANTPQPANRTLAQANRTIKATETGT